MLASDMFFSWVEISLADVENAMIGIVIVVAIVKTVFLIFAI